MTETNAQQVMLVDDDKFLLDMYSVKFSQAGYAVSANFSVQEALQVLRTGAQPDAILFDITMPNSDGYAFLQVIRDEKLSPKSKLIALTNQSSEEDKKHAIDLGAHHYMIKASMIPSEVVNMVREVLGTKSSGK